jgi:phage tail-like protein
MTSLGILPPIPQPPHDPASLTLDRSRGWRAAELENVLVDPIDGKLMLAVAAGSRTLDEPNGSFGGLVPPALVAVGDGCDVWLIDPETYQLKKLDECACAFIDVPCTGGKGSGARQLKHPAGIAFTRGNLFVADSGNSRVSVISVAGYVLRGTIAPPASELPSPWNPVAIAADHRGRVYIADPNNGWVHRFAAHGVWEFAIKNVGDVRHLAVDCRGWLYIVTSTAKTARVFDSHAHEREPAATVGALRGRFARMPFRVDVNGALDFSKSDDPCCCVFDSHGALLPNGAKAESIIFATDGTFRSEPLDSGIAECQWHRVLLQGSIPPGTSITVSTRSSEVAEPDSVVDVLPDDSWETWQTARRPKESDGNCVRWDCLVRSGPGRFLRIRLRLRSDDKATPRLEHATIEFPRISLARYLPGVFEEDPSASDFTDRFLAVFDTTLRSIEKQLDTQAALFDPRSAPASSGPSGEPDFLSWLASWVGISLDRHWPVPKRRQYLRNAPALFDQRGTTQGLRAVLLLYLGLGDPANESRGCLAPGPEPSKSHCNFPNRCEPIRDPCAEPEECSPPKLPALVLEHWRLRRWLLVGTAKLGEQAMLWGKSIVNRSRLGDGARVDQTQLITEQDPFRDPFHVYASTFTVFVPACIARDATARKGLENLLRDESPAHTRWHLELVEPRFRIGVQSMIGYDAVVGCYPEGKVTLDSTTLGRSTILGGAPELAGGPSMRVSSSARIGSTTMLK